MRFAISFLALLLIACSPEPVIVTVVITPTPLPPTSTATATSVPTSTHTPMPTNTPIPTATLTPQPTSTNTPIPTSTPTPTRTWIPSQTPKPTKTRIPSFTPTPTITSTSTVTPTYTPSNTPTRAPTRTPTITPTPKPPSLASLKAGDTTVDYKELYRHVERFTDRYFYFEGMVQRCDGCRFTLVRLGSWERERHEECERWNSRGNKCLDWDVNYGAWYFHTHSQESIWFDDYELTRLLPGDVVQFVGQPTGIMDSSHWPVGPRVKVIELEIIER